MSTTVDNRVLEMQFDNKQFEREVSTSMSTLDKLKQKLSLTEATKGLENLGSAAKKFDLSGMGTAIDTVHAKFSALQIMGTTALMNITNSAVEAGKGLVSAITIEPIKSGFQEYETQINAVQTILANTQHNGTTIKEVNEALDELNHYADLTIYNFTEMTRNIGTFTAAGIDLETSVSAIQGIANLAAVSGSTSQQASTAMYQLSQALAAGTVKLMDWNSVVNAGMGGKVFQDALIKTSEELQTGAKQAIESAGSFRESLKDGWITSEVLTRTLKKFTTSGAVEYLSDYTGVAKEELDTIIADAKAHNDDAKAIDAAAEAIANKSGADKEEIKQALQMAQNAEDAATKVKTLTQLWDVLKEAAQSGWSQTWRILVGDFEEAKALFTPISDYLTGVIGTISDARNNLLESALSSPFSKMLKQVSSFNGSVKKAVKGTKEMASSVEDLESIANKVILGEFGSGEDRINALTEAQYNWMEVQNKVNETLGSSFRYSKEEIDAQNELLGINQKTVDSTKKIASARKNALKSQEQSLDQLAKMSDARLEEIGMTESQIKSLRGLQEAANTAGMSISDFAEKYADLDGKTIIMDTMKNVASALIGVFKALSTAWKQVFPPATAEQLYGLIVKLREMSESIKLTFGVTGALNENGMKLLRTFRGLFSILDIISKITKGAFRAGLEIVRQVLAAFDLNILDVTASIGDAIYAFDRWLTENNYIQKAIEVIVPGIINMGKAIIEWVRSLGKIPEVKAAIDSISEVIQNLVSHFFDFLENLKSLDSLSFKGVVKAFEDSFGEEFKAIEGVIARLKNRFSGLFSVLELIGNIIRTVAEGFFNLFSTGDIGTFLSAMSNAFSVIGKLLLTLLSVADSFAGAFMSIGNVITTIIGWIWDAAKEVFTWIEDNLSAGDIFAGLVGGGVFVTLKKLSKLFDAAKDGISGFFDIFKLKGGEDSVITKFKDMLEGINGALGEFTSGLKVMSIVGIAVAVALLTSSLRKISEIRLDDAMKGIGVIGAMMAMLAGEFKSLSKTLKKMNAKGIVKTSVALILVAEAVKVLSDSVITLSGLSWEKIAKGLTAVGGSLVELSLSMRLIGDKRIPLSTSIAILALAESCRILSDALMSFGNMKWDEIGRGLVAMGGSLAELVASISILQRSSGFNSLAGGLSIFIVVQSLKKMAEGLEEFATMEWTEIGRGLAAMGGALGEISIVVGALAKWAGVKNLFSSFSILIAVQSLDELSEALKSFATNSWDEIGRGLAAMGGALGEIGLVTGALGKWSGVGAILGGADVWLVMGKLDELAAAFISFATNSWDEIGRGLAAMGGALGEIGLVTGALGKWSGLKGILGGAAIFTSVQSLSELAEGFKGFYEVSNEGTWENIGAALASMGGALLEVSAVSGALGSLAGVGGVLGGGSILLVTKGLGDLADAFKKFSELDTDQVIAGLSAMGGALAETALGGVINTFSGLGAASIRTMAEPLGVLADSVLKWTDVTVPEGLGDQIGSLAGGIQKFTFSGFGADSISTVAKPIGDLADSVKKWLDVSVPENLSDQIGSLAGGIKKFIFADFGADAISKVAEPLGILADSAQKWSGITISSECTEGIGNLGLAIRKFDSGGETIATVAEPLGILAESIKKLDVSNIPEDIKTKLSNLADGLEQFGYVYDISSSTEALESLVKSVKSLNGYDFGPLTSGIDLLTSSLKSFGGSDFSSASSALSDVGTSMADGLVSNLSDKMAGTSEAVSKEIAKAAKAAASYESEYKKVGTSLGKAIVDSIGSALSSLGSAVTGPISRAASSISGYRQSFYNSGIYLGDGLISGITSKMSAVRQAGVALGQAAVAGEREGQQSKSPSKATEKSGKWFGQGLINGMRYMLAPVSLAGKEMGETAVEAMSDTVATISDYISSGIDAEPTIRPVLDLSYVQNGVNRMGDMLDLNSKVGISANIDTVKTMMSSQNQNQPNADVVSAIRKLEQSLANLPRNSYQIGSVAYDDGSNISIAMQSLVRAIRIDGRS